MMIFNVFFLLEKTFWSVLHFSCAFILIQQCTTPAPHFRLQTVEEAPGNRWSRPTCRAPPDLSALRQALCTAQPQRRCQAEDQGVLTAGRICESYKFWNSQKGQNKCQTWSNYYSTYIMIMTYYVVRVLWKHPTCDETNRACVVGVARSPAANRSRVFFTFQNG